MQYAFVALLIGSIVCITSDEASAGAWTQERGGGFFKASSQLVRGDQLREVDGSKFTVPTLADYTTSLYGEYGLRDGLTLLAYAPIFKRITLNKQVGRPSGFVYFEGDDISGIGDAQLGLRYRLMQVGATVLSAELVFGLPLGDDSQTNGLLTGDGELNQQLSIQVGHSLYPLPSYFNVDLGFNNRVKGYADEWRYSIEAGYTFGGRLTAIFRLQGIESLENGDSGVSGGMGGLYANNQSYMTYGPELIYNIRPHMGVSLSAANTGKARNALEAPIFSLGIFIKR